MQASFLLYCVLEESKQESWRLQVMPSQGRNEGPAGDGAGRDLEDSPGNWLSLVI